MAKLSNVKTLDMVNGEVTKIEHNGLTYVKTDDKVKVGDIFMLLPGHCVIEGDDNAYYATHGGRGSNVLIDTRYDGVATYVQKRGHGVAFRKTNEATVGERVSSLEVRVSNLEAKKQAQPETITHEGVEYRRVDRVAREGDVVVVRETGDCDLTVGKAYVVTERMSGADAGVIDDVGDNNVVGPDSEEFDVYEPIIAKPAPLQVGDYAKVVDPKASYIAKVGELVEVIATPYSDWDYNTRFLADKYVRPDTEQFNEGEIVRATDEEVAEAKRQAAEKAVADKWADIGRKPKEYREGDIVRVTDGYGGVKIDDIGVVTEADGSQLPGVTIRGEQRYVRVELITPVEHRFDKPAGGSE